MQQRSQNGRKEDKRERKMGEKGSKEIASY
jgi:hypothetical protein